MGQPKSFLLTSELQDYLIRHSGPLTSVQRGLIEDTAKLGEVAAMQISPEQGSFLTVLTRALGVRNAIEVGTFTGYSALCIAMGMADQGRLLCCDISDQWTALGRRAWQDAGVATRISLRLGPALETLRGLDPHERFDLAFIDADKESYSRYWAELVPLIRPGGVLLVDNTLWSGRVVDATVRDERTEVIRAFNAEVVADDRVECALLPVGDGLTVAVRR
ncbi:MAG: O-methyltransferase [Candidatus Dormibacteria bacterium]